MAEAVLYQASRLWGVDCWVLGEPEKQMIRLPNSVLDCVAFLCIEKSTRHGTELHFGGTAFFLSLRCSHPPNISFVYLVTARHNVDQAAAKKKPLLLRLNKKDGGVETVEIRAEWTFPEDGGSDIAVMPLRFLGADLNPFDIQAFAFESIVADYNAEKWGIGIGDEVFIPGLFTYHHGTNRNLPIVRVGNIASMPVEPFYDERIGCHYMAFLIEARSFGGLSGSPVFMLRQVNPEHLAKPYHVAFRAVMIGLVRGHFDYKVTGKRGSQKLAFNDDERAAVNMGLAMVTPGRELFDLLQSEQFREDRKRFSDERLRQRRGRPIDD